MPKYFKDADGQLYRADVFSPVSIDEELLRLKGLFASVKAFQPITDEQSAATLAATQATAAPAPQPIVDQPIVPVAVTPPVQPLQQPLSTDIPRIQ